MRGSALARPLVYTTVVAALCLPTEHDATTFVPQLGNFDLTCAKVASFPKDALSEVTDRAVEKLKGEGVTIWGDRAVVLNIDHDSKPEYFVPLVCTAGGNCHWGIFSIAPPQERGFVFGANVYVYMRFEPFEYPTWIETYSYIGSGDALVETYDVREGKVVEVSLGILSGQVRDDFLEEKGPLYCPHGPS